MKLLMLMSQENPYFREPKYLLLWRPDWLRKHYLELGLAMSQIAEIVGCKENTVRHAIISLQLKRRRYTMSKKAIYARCKGGATRKVKINNERGVQCQKES